MSSLAWLLCGALSWVTIRALAELKRVKTELDEYKFREIARSVKGSHHVTPTKEYQRYV